MKLSIITPSFQNSEWLKLCIESVADQKIEHEHIIQDAGSNDGTIEWLPYEKRVRLFIEKDSGMYDALNRGLRKATGEYVAHLNCDEQYVPGALAAAARFLDSHSEVDVLFADAIAVNGDGDYLWHRKMLRPLIGHTWTNPLSILTCATFFRRGILDKHQLFFDPQWKYVGDSEWVAGLFQKGLRAEVTRTLPPPL